MGTLRIESEFKRTTDKIPTLQEWLEDFFKVTKYIKKGPKFDELINKK